ncbi:hypothetical protein FHS23_002918 [Prauserella isguenensis]|uniref:Glyoxalase-like domain-containing protein n=1 Tax=Prauserella isguenensis TaxID=1470180 RepID=A0A839S594_9PSEU|nr:VOC family protein [Prauserella isguenensis]MBB3051889.1 hypothetical protein [Prauserella isguenensis]
MPGVVFEAEQPRAVAEFWAALLGGELAGDDGGWRVRLADGPTMRFVGATAGKTTKNRIHLDLASGGVDGPGEQNTIVDRAIRLGAARVDIGQYSGAIPAPWQVLADPAGNEFCVLEPRPEYAATGALAAVVIESPDPHRLAEFWSGATQWPIVRTEPEFVSLRDADGRGPWLELLSAEPCPPVTPRCRLELAVPASDGDAAAGTASAPAAPGEFAAEADRLCLLGAARRGAGRLIDPDGTVIDLVPGR